MPAVRRILVAIKNPGSKSLPALAKAARLAHGFNAQLLLCHAITESVPSDAHWGARSDVAKLFRETLAHQQRHLEGIAERLRQEGLDVHVCAVWDYPAHEAIVRHARRHNADLIVAECHTGRRLAPWLLHLTDWELLRTSPVPVLLIRNGAPWDRLSVLAAIDPAHRFAKPAKLDARILEAAEEFTRALNVTLHVAHAYLPVPAGAGALAGTNAALLRQIAKESRARAKKNLYTALADRHLPRDCRHLTEGSPAEAIARLARQLGCGMVVMGAISRSGLKRVFIGNTAERILSSLSADVLVVKPVEFETSVAKRGRGIHFTGLPSLMLPRAWPRRANRMTIASTPGSVRSEVEMDHRCAGRVPNRRRDHDSK